MDLYGSIIIKSLQEGERLKGSNSIDKTCPGFSTVLSQDFDENAIAAHYAKYRRDFGCSVIFLAKNVVRQFPRPHEGVLKVCTPFKIAESSA